MRTTPAAAVIAAMLLATACRPEPILEQVDPTPTSAAPVTTSPATTPTTAPTRTPSATPIARSGPKSATCVNGWTEPKPGTALRTRPLDLLRRSQGFDKEFRVIDMRYFTGPDDANKDPGDKEKSVERWYGQVSYAGDPRFRIRFLAVRRSVGEGIVAIARYDTSGFRSPDWYGFDGEGGKSTYPGLPGTWPGMPYDYVEAGELPSQVRGCLAPTS